MTNEELNKIMMKADNDLERLKDRCHELYEENERKERLITQYGEGMCAYANRIDKAIEYIKENSWKCEGEWCIENADDLLNILQESDKE